MKDAYLYAADSAIDLVAHPAVAARWDEPSALAAWSVGGLAAHLAAQVSMVPGLLEQPGTAHQPIPLAEHYARAAWVGATVDDEVNVAIRRGGDDAAVGGHAAVEAAARAARARAADLLAAESGDRPVVIPWQGWALRLDDFLVTRMMEIAVHSDDLAVSVSLGTPELPVETIAPVFALLTSVAASRHGQTSVLRALSRAERAPTEINAF